MKKNLLIFLFTAVAAVVNAANVAINIVGFSYSPSSVTVNVGDVVTIQANLTHPCVQVSETDWNTNTATELAGGWGTISTAPSFNRTIVAADAGTTIFFMCANHGPLNGMKGKIVVNIITGLGENAKKDFNFTIYPNPVRNNSVLNISLKKNDKVDLKVFSINGKLVSNYLQQKMNAGEYTMPFDAARLETGIYIMQLKTSLGVLRKQIMVTH